MTKYAPPADPKAPWRVVLCTDGARDAAIDEDTAMRRPSLTT